MHADDTQSGFGDWSSREAEHARLTDGRFRRVLAEALAARAARCDLSFSGACGGALRQAAGRLLRHPEIEPDDLLSGHRQATLERCLEQSRSGRRRIVIAQDSTSYNYSTHKATTGLGPLNDKASVSGIHQHSALAMTADKLPLGIVHAKFWARPGQKKAAGSRRALPIAEKESYKWIETALSVEDLFAPLFAAGGEAVLVGDREADIFDVFAAPRHERLALVVRAAQSRSVKLREQGEGEQGEGEQGEGEQGEGEQGEGEQGEGEPAPSEQKPAASLLLFEAIPSGAVLGTYEIEVPKRGKQPKRQASMQVRSVQVALQPPKTGVRSRADGRADPPKVWAVQVSEVMPAGCEVMPAGCEVMPAGCEAAPLEWTLLTTLDASTLAAAREVVAYYTCRWEIEQLHLTLKSGCQAEKLQMDDAATLCNTLALYIIVAWRLLAMTRLARVAPDAPAREVIDETEQAVLAQAARRPMATVKDVVAAVARLAGYEPYKNGPPPGVKSLWLGLRQLESMAQGWRLAMESIRLQKM